MIKYSLRENNLKPEEQRYMARIENLITFDLDKVKAEITRKGSVLKKTETNGVIDELFEYITQNLSQGIAFHSKYFSIIPSIKGNFEGEEDAFDRSRHQMMVNMVPGQAMRAAINSINPEKTEYLERDPAPKHILNTANRQMDTDITAGHMAEVTGKRLKVIDPEDPNQGVFLIKTDDQETFKADWLKINTPGKVEFQVPMELIAGEYSLEIRTTVYENARRIRKAELPFTIELS